MYTGRLRELVYPATLAFYRPENSFATDFSFQQLYLTAHLVSFTPEQVHLERDKVWNNGYPSKIWLGIEHYYR